MKELKVHKSKFSESKSYPVLKSKFLKGLPKSLTSKEKREALKGFDKGFSASQGMPDWFKDMPPFLDPEYRIHPIMGHQVRSRHVFEPEGSTHEQRIAEKKTSPRRKPKITPYDLDPAYRDKGEKEHLAGDLDDVKQYPVTIEEEQIYPEPTFGHTKSARLHRSVDIPYPEPTFDHIESARLRRSVDLLDLKIGYDHKTNAHVLYSPLKYNERWDQQSQAIWLRTIGMSPKRIGVKLNIKYDTIKNWLRALKGHPLVAATQHDWAVRQVDGSPELASKRSSTEAKHRSMEAL